MIKKCPKCGSRNLHLSGVMEFIFGADLKDGKFIVTYDQEPDNAHHVWMFCRDCGAVFEVEAYPEDYWRISVDKIIEEVT